VAAQPLGEHAGEQRLPAVDCQHAELGLACAAADGLGLREQLSPATGDAPEEASNPS